jgi:hypothetical protein
MPGCGGQHDGADATEELACSGPACCIPVSVERERSRAYLVDGTLYIDTFASHSATAPAGAMYWAFDVSLTGGVIPETFSKPISSHDFQTVLAFHDTSVTPNQAVACGDNIQVELRLSSSTYDEGGQPVCTGDGFGPAIPVELSVECPVCPAEAEVQARTECDFPLLAGCPASAYNPFMMRLETVRCQCGGPSQTEPPRRWSCPVF